MMTGIHTGRASFSGRRLTLRAAAGLALLLPLVLTLGTSAQSQVFTPQAMPPTVIVGGPGQQPVVVNMDAVDDAARHDYAARRLMMPGAEAAYRSRLMLRQPNVRSSSVGSAPRATTSVQERRPAPAPALLSASGSGPVGGAGRHAEEPDFAMVDNLLDSLSGDAPQEADVADPVDLLEETSDADYAAMFDTSPEVTEGPQEEVVAVPRVDVTKEPLAEDLSDQVATAPEPLMPIPATETEAVEEEVVADISAAAPEPILETVTALPEEVPAAAPEPATKPATESANKKPTQLASLPTQADSGSVLRQVMVEFEPDSIEISGDMESMLDALGARLVKENTRIKLQAFASKAGDAAGASRRLSLKRALAVRSHLIEHGVRSTRIDVRANGIAGDDKPSERVDVSVTQ